MNPVQSQEAQPERVYELTINYEHETPFTCTTPSAWVGLLLLLLLLGWWWWCLEAGDFWNIANNNKQRWAVCVGATMYLLCRHVLSWFWAVLPYRSLVVNPWNSAIVESFIAPPPPPPTPPPILIPLSVAVAAQKLLHGSEIIPIRQPLRGAFYSAEEEIEMEGDP